MTTMSYVEARKKINSMQEAKDAFGNRLYDDLEIANYFGYESVERLNQILAQARSGYRKALISNVDVLQKAGKTKAEIAEIMHLTEGTVEVLLDTDIESRLGNHKEIEKTRQEMFTKQFDSLFNDLFTVPSRK